VTAASSDGLPFYLAHCSTGRRWTPRYVIRVGRTSIFFCLPETRKGPKERSPDQARFMISGTSPRTAF